MRSLNGLKLTVIQTILWFYFDWLCYNRLHHSRIAAFSSGNGKKHDFIQHLKAVHTKEIIISPPLKHHKYITDF